MPELIILIGFAVGSIIVIVGGVLLYGACYRYFRNPPPPINSEPSSDLSEYRQFLSQQPTVDEIREKMPLDFDATVEKYRNKKEI